jgi:hypothetical protein
VTKTKQLQQIIRLYKQRTDSYEIDMRKVAEFAVHELGIELPKPVDPLDLLAKKFTSAAREETRIDSTTGLPYRANHAVPKSGSQQCLWIDIDEATRALMQKSAVKRREQIVGDALQLELDVQHWNRVNPHEDPINIPLDFTEDVEERINSQLHQDDGDSGTYSSLSPV